MEEFEYNGKWWLPENPDKKISGTLRFDPTEGLSLELIGSFKTSKDFNVFLAPNIILGLASNGKYITLYECFESGSQESKPGFLSSSFFAQVAFIGHHFEKEEDIVFDSLSLTYSHLEEWTAISGVKITTDPNLTISYNPPERIGAKLDDFHIFVDFIRKFRIKRNIEYKLKQFTFIEIEPHEKIHFNDYRKKICYHIQNFLSLAIGKAVYPLTIEGKTEACRIELPNRKMIYRNILIFYPLKKPSDTSEILFPNNMLFSFKDISDNFEKYLRNWFKKSEMLSPVYDLYFGTLYNLSMYLNHRFLSLVQAIESYHRRVHNGKYLPNDDYCQIYKKLIEAVPKDADKGFRKSLEEKLKYHNEFSLRKRLKEILEICGDAVNLLIHDNNGFINDVVNTRNFLTHYDKSLEMIAKKDKELYELVLKMKFILEICLLMELGMSTEEIEDLLSRNRKYKQLAKKEA